ncbi:MAG: response regulator [Geminicoccaceae bacterium]
MPSRTPSPPVPAAGRTILIVGDLPLSRGLMRMVLTRLDYMVSCVGSAREAATALAHSDFAVALIALNLPDMGGLALARSIAEQQADAPQRLPLVLFGDAWDLEAVTRTPGIDAYLPKPISPARLVATVRRLADAGHHPQGPAAMSEAGDQPIDLPHFRGFTNGDRQLERELASLFVSTAAIYLGEMKDALAQRRDWSGPAHALKGASANIGARSVATLAARSEKTAPTDEALAALQASVDTVRQFFERQLGPIDPPRAEG